ncbi:MAG: hypothetical protein ACQEUT_18190 [Bacillota bacterium]
MANLIDEMESFVSYLTGLFSDATVERQNVPTNPVPHTFVVKMNQTNPEQHQEYIFIERTYSIIYIAEDDLTLFNTIETLRQDLHAKKQVIPLNNSTNVIRVTSLGYSEPFEYEEGSNLKGVIFVLTSRTQEVTPAVVGPLIQVVNTRK